MCMWTVRLETRPPNITHILSIESQVFDMCDRIKTTYIYIYMKHVKVTK